MLALLAWENLMFDGGLYIPPGHSIRGSVVVIRFLASCKQVFHHSADNLLVMVENNGLNAAITIEKLFHWVACGGANVCNWHDAGTRTRTRL